MLRATRPDLGRAALNRWLENCLFEPEAALREWAVWALAVTPRPNKTNTAKRQKQEKRREYMAGKIVRVNGDYCDRVKTL